MKILLVKIFKRHLAVGAACGTVASIATYKALSSSIDKCLNNTIKVAIDGTTINQIINDSINDEEE